MSDAGYSMLGAGAWRWPREMLWGGRWEGGSCLGTHVRIKDFKIKKNKKNKSPSAFYYRCVPAVLSDSLPQNSSCGLRPQPLLQLLLTFHNTYVSFKLAHFNNLSFKGHCIPFGSYLREFPVAQHHAQHTGNQLTAVMWTQNGLCSLQRKVVSGIPVVLSFI